MPTVQAVHVDRFLSNMSLMYRNPLAVGLNMLPTVDVVNESDKYPIYDKSNLRVEPAMRAVGAESREIDYDITSDSYVAAARALKKLMPDRVTRNQDNPLSQERDTTIYLTDKLELIREVETADLLTNSATYSASHTLTLSGTSQWNDYDNSDPNQDVEYIREQIQADSLKMMNSALIPWQVWLKLKYHPALLGRLSTASTRILTVPMLADLWELENIWIAASMKNTGIPGGTDTLSRVWGKHVVFGYVEANPTLQSASLGKTFRTVRQVKRWREEPREGLAMSPMAA